MKSAVFRPVLAVALTIGNASAQDATSPRAATSSPAAAASAPPSAPRLAQHTWIVSETRSPVDYSPVAIATTSAGELQLSIQCRGGRTEMVVSSPRLALRVDTQTVSYTVNDGAPVPIAFGASSSGNGLALRVDVPRLLMALPDRGELSLRITGRQSQALEARVALAGLRPLHGRMAGPCKWSSN
jgi:hypothetical protein